MSDGHTDKPELYSSCTTKNQYLGVTLLDHEHLSSTRKYVNSPSIKQYERLTHSEKYANPPSAMKKYGSSPSSLKKYGGSPSSLKKYTNSPSLKHYDRLPDSEKCASSPALTKKFDNLASTTSTEADQSSEDSNSRKKYQLIHKTYVSQKEQQ